MLGPGAAKRSSVENLCLTIREPSRGAAGGSQKVCAVSTPPRFPRDLSTASAVIADIGGKLAAPAGFASIRLAPPCPDQHGEGLDERRSGAEGNKQFNDVVEGSWALHGKYFSASPCPVSDAPVLLRFQISACSRAPSPSPPLGLFGTYRRVQNKQAISGTSFVNDFGPLRS